VNEDPQATDALAEEFVCGLVHIEVEGAAYVAVLAVRSGVDDDFAVGACAGDGPLGSSGKGLYIRCG